LTQSAAAIMRAASRLLSEPFRHSAPTARDEYHLISSAIRRQEQGDAEREERAPP
jgi:hypothetical protein